jgi:hypothetical protein
MSHLLICIQFSYSSHNNVQGYQLIMKMNGHNVVLTSMIRCMMCMTKYGKNHMLWSEVGQPGAHSSRLRMVGKGLIVFMTYP